MKWPVRRTGLVVGAFFLGLFIVLPFIGLHVPWVLPGTLDIVNSTGTLEVLALCFMFAGIAVGYDLMFGYTGLMSLGPVLYFAVGTYVFDIALTHWGWALIPSLLLTFGVSLVLAVVLGAIALRFPGETLKWDDHAARFTNNIAANAYVTPIFRKGWKI